MDDPIYKLKMIYTTYNSPHNPYSCYICGKVFTKRKNVVAHLRTHSGDRPFKCDLCPKAFKTKRELTNHKLRHGGLKVFGCEFCESKFAVPKDLRQHRLRIHKKVNKKAYQFVKCPVCEKRLEIAETLEMHMITCKCSSTLQPL